MKKICFIIPNLGGGGAERVATHLLNNLNLEKYDLTLIIMYKDKGDYLKKLRKEVKIEFLNVDRIRFGILPIFKFLNKNHFDIVMVFSEDVMIFLGIFVVPFIKNTIFINRHLSVFLKDKKSIFRKYSLKVAYRNYDKVISQSKDMTESLLKNKLVSENKITEINNPVDFKNIDILSNKQEELEFDENFKNIIAVGRLFYQKGFDILINSMKSLINENIKLFILGEGPERKKLEKLIKDFKLENKIFLIGRKSNPYIYMKNADLFILSSRFEGFPNVLLEANACGCYAICNNSPGGINEIIQENINGNIINFENEEIFSKTIKRELMRNHDKEKIIKIVKDKYSLENIISKYEEYLDDINI